MTEVLFRKARLVELEGHQRLSFPSLETWSASARPSLAEAGVDWPERVATHCHYMADKVKNWCRNVIQVLRLRHEGDVEQSVSRQVLSPDHCLVLSAGFI